MKKKTISVDSVRNILLIQLGDIGDVVLTFPAIRALKENFPGARTIVAVREKAKELIEDCPWADGVISIDKKKRSLREEVAHQCRFFAGLRSYRFDIAADMKTGERGAILALCSGARQRVSFFSNDGFLWRNRVFNRLVLDEGRPGRHMTHYYLSLMASYGISTPHIRPEYVVPEKRKAEARNLLAQEGVPLHRPIIALQPFSLWRYKEWGVAKYVQLVDWLVSTYGVTAIISGSEDERAKAEEIRKQSRGRTFNIAGKTSIGVLPAVFQACRLFIGVDSAGMHLAAAVGIPTVSIFGPSPTEDWAPRGEQHRFVRKDLPCVPCRNKGCYDSEISRCLDELTVEEVKAAVQGHIEKYL